MLVATITPEMAERVTHERTNEWSKLKFAAEKARNALRIFEKMFVKDGKVIVPQYVAVSHQGVFTRDERWTVEEILAREG